MVLTELTFPSLHHPPLPFFLHATQMEKERAFGVADPSSNVIWPTHRPFFAPAPGNDGGPHFGESSFFPNKQQDCAPGQIRKYEKASPPD